MAQLHKVIFTRPPEAPVFCPTEEEFQSPLLYIQSIKPTAEKYGICKIIPPKSFKPPFAVNKETFKFKARYQRLCDLDAFSRSRHSFACMLRRFWSDQGWPSDLVAPTIGERVVEWYDLYITVYREGGYKNVCGKADGWSNVAKSLGISSGSYPNASKELKIQYDKNLLAYDEFRAQVELYVDKDHDNFRPVNKSAGCRRMAKETDSSSSPTALVEAICSVAKPTNGVNSGGSPMKNEDGNSSPDGKRSRMRRSISNVNYSEMTCEICKETDDFANLKFCEKCERTYHARCIPPNIRKDKTKLWLCPKCMKETFENLRACHTFGFDSTNTPYTLDDFQRKANEFKRSYFGSSNVGLAIVEEEFWRVLANPLDETVVEYGADLHRGEQGSSGFPTDSDRPLLRESEKEYIDHPWNLNKLPDDDLSILKHITVQISGMKVPWMYVGMVFSAFCWHTEDHWSASINYLHMGEPKTWYGVPGTSADAFETAFKQLVPVLTESNPDLMHQLVTHMNPSVLQSCGVPVFRTDQRAGEFVITFPRAYHAGFNQGFNFAEAVNFCLADWLPHGRSSISHYANCKRELVFSHDELICCMADQANALHSTIAKACYKDFSHMVEEESANREYLVHIGIALDDEPTLFEFMDDHERACFTCRTTLFLSAVQCACSNERLSCGKHVENLCTCDMSNRRLLYRYSIDDLHLLLDKLLKRTEAPDIVEPKPQLSGSTVVKRSANVEPKAPVKKPKLGQYQESGPMDFFGDYEASGNSELKALMKMASELVSPQTLTRGRDADGTPSTVKRWKVGDVEGLITSLMSFPGTTKEVSHVREYLRKHYALQNDMRTISQLNPEEQNLDFVRRVYDQARSSNIEMVGLVDIQLILQQTDFRERICNTLNDARSTIETLGTVLQSADEILIRTPYLDNLISFLTKLIDEGRNIEIDAEEVVSHGAKVSLPDAIALVERAEAYPIELKNIDIIRDGIDMIERLTDTLESRKSSGQRLHMLEIKAALADHQVVNFYSGSVGIILEIYAKANEFVNKLHKLFFGNMEYGPTGGHPMTLIDVLCPRRVKQVKSLDDDEEEEEEDTEQDEDDTEESGSGKKSGEIVLGEPINIDPLDLITGHPLDLDLNENYDLDELTSLFERAARDEEIYFEQLREANCLKSAIDSDTRESSNPLRRELRWCVCGERQLGSMVQCDSCFDWFHVTCTRMAEFVHDDGIADFQLVHELIENIQFMCDLCQRGVRPPIECVKQLFYEYKDVQRFISVPEIDLLSLVIARAEKWRRRATNMIAELPSAISKVDTLCISNDELMDRICRRLRDTVLAILLQGNLLEVKMPEWVFLYNFVHENFRKDRLKENHEAPSLARHLILPTRSHGRCPIAVDMISPLFRQLNVACKPDMSSIDVKSDMDKYVDEKQPVVTESLICSKRKTRPVKRYADGAESPSPEPVYPRHRSQRKNVVESRNEHTLSDRQTSSLASMTVRTRLQFHHTRGPLKNEQNVYSGRRNSLKPEKSDESEEDNASGTCSVCSEVFPSDSLLSTVSKNHGIVLICTDCKDARIGSPQKSSSGSLSDIDAGILSMQTPIHTTQGMSRRSQRSTRSGS